MPIDKIWTIVVFVNRSHTHVLQNTTLLPHCLITLEVLIRCL